MIRPISNISAQGVKSLKPQRVARQVLNTANSLPKGITKTPVRMLDGQGEQILKYGLGACIGTSAVTCASEFCIGFSAGVAGA